jgi:hypothetical protein
MLTTAVSLHAPSASIYSPVTFQSSVMAIQRMQNSGFDANAIAAALGLPSYTVDQVMGALALGPEQDEAQVSGAVSVYV